MERFAEFVANERLHEEEMEKDHEEATDDDCIPLTYAGEFELTAYCSCSLCCGVETGIMASGNEVYSGAIGSNFFELGTKLYVEGYGCFVVEDTGNMESVVLDIWMPSHEEALEFGRQYADVYVMEE